MFFFFLPRPSCEAAVKERTQMQDVGEADKPQKHAYFENVQRSAILWLEEQIK